MSSTWATVLLPMSLILAGAGLAHAGIVAVGQPKDIGSWGQTFEESDVGSFDLIAVRISSDGDAFKQPTFLKFSEDEWQLLYEDSDCLTLASAAGTTATTLRFDIHFDGDISESLTFDFVAMSGDTIVDSALITWSGSEWGFDESSWDPPGCVRMVPLPSAMWLGLSLLGGFGLWRRRRGG